jgi:hypothetical protein
MRSNVLRTIASIPVAAVALLSGYVVVAGLRVLPAEAFTVILVIAAIGFVQLAIGLAVALVLAWLRPSRHPTATALVASAVFLIAYIIGCFDSGMISIFEVDQIVIFAVVLAICCGLVFVVSTGRLSP